MSVPEFFAAAPTLRVRDPLADFLGAAAGGLAYAAAFLTLPIGSLAGERGRWLRALHLQRA